MFRYRSRLCHSLQFILYWYVHCWTLFNWWWLYQCLISIFKSLLETFLFFCENIIALCKQYFIHFFLNENFENFFEYSVHMLLRISFKSPIIKSGMRNEFRNMNLKRFTVNACVNKWTSLLCPPNNVSKKIQWYCAMLPN